MCDDKQKVCVSAICIQPASIFLCVNEINNMKWHWWVHMLTSNM